MNKEELSKAILNGDNNKVLNYLYKKILPLVRKYITRNNGNKDEADDVFQDAVLVMYKKIIDQKAHEIPNIDGFMLLTCKNLWINRVNKLNKLYDLEQLSAEEDTTNNGLDDILDQEKNNAFQKLFEMVGEKCKEILVLAIFNKKSMEEIAVLTNLTSANAAKTQHYRCKQRLASLVEQDVTLKTILKS